MTHGKREMGPSTTIITVFSEGIKAGDVIIDSPLGYRVRNTGQTRKKKSSDGTTDEINHHQEG